MGPSELSQAERLELRRREVLHLIDWELATDTLHLSDRPFRYKYGATEILYEPYVREIVRLDKALSYGVGSGNDRVTIVLFNHKWGSYDYLIQLNAVQPFTRSTVTIHELRVVEEEETFSADERVTLCKLSVERVERITRESFLLVCSSRLFDKRGALGLQKVNTTTFPNADPDDVGQYRNILYGDLEYVPARAVRAGAVDVLVADIDASQTTGIYVSLSGRVALPSSGTVQIDDEQITYTSLNNTTGELGGVTRGANGTTAAGHSKGAGVFEVLGEYVYELAAHPIKAIHNVYVDNVRQDSGYTAYTGQSGDEHPSYPGTAVVAFSVKPTIKKQVNLDAQVDAEHDHETTSLATMQKNGASASGIGSAGNAIDGDENSCTAWSAGDTLTITMEAGEYGTIDKIEVHILIETSEYSADCPVKYSGVQVGVVEGNTPKSWKRFTSSAAGALDWTGKLKVTTGNYRVYEAYVVFYYQPTISRVGSTQVSLTGTSSADVVIGSEVTADVEGYKDDASGTYTGTPDALIERPDHVIRHILVELMGFSSSEIGSSFAASGTSYATEQHKFAFILHDVATDAMRLLQELARQCRSLFFEWGGKFELVFLHDSPSADHTILEDEWQKEPLFAYTSTAEIKNKMRALYRRDYRSVHGVDAGPTVISGIKEDVRARGYMDMLENTYGDGDLAEDLMLNAVRTSTHAQDVVDYWHGWKKQERLTIEGTLSWEAMRMAPGDHFSWADPVMGTKTYRLERFVPDRASGRVRIKATAVD